MSLIRYNPFTAKLHPLNGFFDGNISNFLGSDFINNQPSVNISESDTSYRVALAAPGLSKEDFIVSLDKDVLTIAVEKKNEQVEETEKFSRKEFSYTSFKRSFNISKEINPTDISATYEDGILNIILPKKEKGQNEVKRSIEIS